ncbi:hypothetical protein C8Q76DRAFT_726037 [Earliella scabrosa]|nr:hypothetical protein C8Q76DRAFT_726037 [Earliella scabrosa]
MRTPGLHALTFFKFLSILLHWEPSLRGQHSALDALRSYSCWLFARRTAHRHRHLLSGIRHRHYSRTYPCYRLVPTNNSD